MSSDLDQARLIAERIARRVSENPPSTTRLPGSEAGLASELAAMRASLGDLQRRLIQIETKVRAGTTPRSNPIPITEPRPSGLQASYSPWLAGVNANAAHASQERFGVEEATVTELVDFFQNEKLCSVEPGGKPCDHCSMCSSRGF